MIQKSISLKYEPSWEPLHMGWISARLTRMRLTRMGTPPLAGGLKVDGVTFDERSAAHPVAS